MKSYRNPISFHLHISAKCNPIHHIWWNSQNIWSDDKCPPLAQVFEHLVPIGSTVWGGGCRLAGRSTLLGCTVRVLTIPYFQFTLFASCLLLKMSSPSFLLWLPAAIPPAVIDSPLKTTSQKRTLSPSVTFGHSIYHNNRKAPKALAKEGHYWI